MIDESFKLQLFDLFSVSFFSPLAFKNTAAELSGLKEIIYFRRKLV